ncbi:unnamed protein product [Symbiodinium microadriaticum]|nr:unnamed protein product [Symbiodinium sp. KB8]CAE7199928.1 unnamed protein product [Symbiodinium microadriaticum]
MPWHRSLKLRSRGFLLALVILGLGWAWACSRLPGAFVYGCNLAPTRHTSRPAQAQDVMKETLSDFAEAVVSENSTATGSIPESTADFWRLTDSERSIGGRSRITKSAAIVVLGVVTVLWGSQHSIIKYTLQQGANDSLQAASLNLVRFGLAGLCFSPWLPAARPERQGVRARLEWRAGAELGFWLFLGFCLQAAGLLYTTAQRSGLLLYLNVKLVPFFAWSIFGRAVPLSAWLSALAAFLGTLLVAMDDAAGVDPNIGDLLSLLAAAASAMFILRLETFAPVTDDKAINAVSTLSVALLCVPWALLVACGSAPAEVLGGPVDGLAASAVTSVAGRCWDLVLNQPLSVLYLGVLTTAFTNWLQTIGQQSVPATTASAIYALDPLWGAFFAYLFLGEALGPQGLLGCLLLFAVWLYQLASTFSEEQPEQPRS